MSNGRNGSFFSAARWRRKSSNIVFQQLEWIVAVDVRTPSRSNSTASNRSGVMGLWERLMVTPLVRGDTSPWRQQGRPCRRRGLVMSFLLLHVVALGRGAASGASRRGAAPRRPAPARDLRHVVAVLPNVLPVHEDVQTRRGAPVTEQPRLDVFALEGLLQEGVVQQVDLADGQVVQRPKVSVHLAQFFRGARACHRLTAVRGFPFRLGDYECHRCSPWVLGSSLAGFPWRPRPRSGEPRYFGPRPDSVVVPLALRWAAFFAGCLFL